MSVRKIFAATALTTIMGACSAIAGEMKDPTNLPIVESEIMNENTAANFDYDKSNSQAIHRGDNVPVVEDEIENVEGPGKIEPYRPQTAERGEALLDPENNPLVGD